MYKHFFANSSFDSVIAPLPRHLIIEPTNYCNYSCFMCPNRYYRDNQKGVMQLEKYRSVIDCISSFAKVIQLYWVGEPLLNQQIFEMIRYAKTQTDSVVVLSTNASLLDSEASEHLYESGIDIVILSLDAIVSENTYSSIRCKGELINVKDNITRFIQDNNHRIRIWVQLLDFNMNANDRLIAESYFMDKDCEVHYSWIDTWAGTLPELESYAEMLSPQRNTKRSPCADLWNKATIGWDGELYLCCHDWQRNYRLGSIHEKSFDEIWNSQQMQEIREKHINQHFEEVDLCARCQEWAVIEEYGEFLPR